MAREAGGSGSSLPRATGKSRERVGGETVQAQALEEKVADGLRLRAERGSPHQHAAGLLIGETRLFQRLTLLPHPKLGPSPAYHRLGSQSQRQCKSSPSGVALACRLAVVQVKVLTSRMLRMLLIYLHSGYANDLGVRLLNGKGKKEGVEN